ncbi:uncharacterized protein K444DRAFT_660946 [Hyaloscypha bicolor E]|uniref:Uncharacterized protein n=1 Tax=Hyaloscypha bicolor E TaxID=1095630 RepID=A0A2J6TKB9_9HELO|nr:uncharacterized protein K444DRAFT_660946 [Hyaloscypha bicolor E]PMD63460.1 hypothetical protein K444DRAFT_660946 [Hyaloscypha bicolor E]
MSTDEKMDGFEFPTIGSAKMDARFDAQRASFPPKRRVVFAGFLEKLCQNFLLVVMVVLVSYSVVTCALVLLGHPTPTPLGQPRVHLDPALKFNATIISTAEQLTSLQDRLSVRMDQHNVIMSKNLDNFTSTLETITADAEVAIDYLRFVEKYLFVGASRTPEEWREGAEVLEDEIQKLHNIAVSQDIRMEIEAVTQIAGAIATEMTDMELFMQEISSASNTLLNRLGKVFEEQAECNGTDHLAPRSQPQQPIYDAPASDAGQSLNEAQPGRTLQWRWDEIHKGGYVRSNMGDFAPIQQAIIETFLLSMNATGNITSVPTTIRYGIGLPDTHPTDLGTLGYEHPLIIQGFSIPTPDPDSPGQNYNCDIVAHFAQMSKDAIVQVKVAPGLRKEVVVRQLVGLQSMECGAEGEEKKDVVRYKEKGEDEKKQWQILLRVG